MLCDMVDSVVFRLHGEERARMRANGARLRRGVADDDMSAVEADPNDLIALFE